MGGNIFIENIGATTCGLGGYPLMRLRDQSGRMLPVKVVDVGTRLLPPAVRHPRPVTLAPQQQHGTGFNVQWFNWCGSAHGAVSLRLVLPDEGELRVEATSAVLNFSGRPRCDDRNRQSWIDVSPIAVTLDGSTATPQVPLGTPLCRASQLSVHGGLQGGGFGTALGTVELTNIGGSRCVLSGDPAVALLGTTGTSLAISTVPSTSPRTSPIVLEPDGSGRFEFSWANWCGSAPGSLEIDVTMAGSTTALVGALDGPPATAYVPRCENSSSPSTLMVIAAFGS